MLIRAHTFRACVACNFVSPYFCWAGRPRGGELPIGTRGRASRALGVGLASLAQRARFARSTNSLRSFVQAPAPSAGCIRWMTLWSCNWLHNWLHGLAEFVVKQLAEQLLNNSLNPTAEFAAEQLDQ